MQIRQIEERDNAAIAQVIRNIFEEFGAPRCGTVYTDPTTDDLYALFRQPGSIYWVAETDSEIAGGCGIFPTPGLPPHYAEMVKFYIAPQARGKGLGKELMQKSIEWAQEHHYTHLYIESLPQFAKAVSIYEKQGFVPIAHSLGQSGHSSCNIWLLKDLT